MFGLSTEDEKAWLYSEVINGFKKIKAIGCAEGGVVQEVLLVHYAMSGELPDFSSTRYHWSTHIATTTDGCFYNTGNAQQYTDLFFIKLGFPFEYDNIDVMNGEIAPVISAGFTQRGIEFALDLNEAWLSTYNLELPLRPDYIGHIKLCISEGNQFIKRLD